MKYDSPKIEHIKQLLPLVEGRKDFAVIKQDGYTSIRYTIIREDTFNHPLLLECRGIKFDDDGKILARPFHKFFNYGEKQSAGADLTRPHVLTLKVDGSMIHPAIIDDEIVPMTKAGITEVALKANRIITSHNYENFIRKLDAQGITPIFEFSGPSNPVVLSYADNELTLLAARNKVTGEYMPRTDLVSLARNYRIPEVTDVGEVFLGEQDLSQLNEQVKRMKNLEGLVVQYNEGGMLKIKTTDYLEIHKLIEGLQTKKQLLRLMADRKITNEFLARLPERTLHSISTFQENIYAELRLLYTTIHDFWRKNKFLPRKDYALRVNEEIPAPLRHLYFRILDNHTTISREILEAFAKNPDLTNTEYTP